MVDRGTRPDAVTLTLGRYAADEGAGTQGVVFIDGSEGASVQLATCCRPIPGDGVVGYLGRGEGLVVHTGECHVGKRLFERDSERWMQVEWAEELTRPFETAITRAGAATARACWRRWRRPSAAPRPTSRTSTWATERASESAELKLLISVRDRLHLAEVLRAVRRSPAVQRVWRVKP